MDTPIGERTLQDAILNGKALLKFISPNDVGLTGSHQCGYYIPKKARHLLTPYAPNRGQNRDHRIQITWPDGRITNSVVKWYGNKTRSEYRLTRFGKDFPWLAEGCVGDLLVLIPTGPAAFAAYVLDTEEDIIQIQAALGVEVHESFAVYESGARPAFAGSQECIERRFRELANRLEAFPPTRELAEKTRAILELCISGFRDLAVDRRLTKLIEQEYALFRMIERQLCQAEIARPFISVGDFLKTAGSIMNRRKSRAGWSLENHFDTILRESNVPFEARPRIDGNAQPDILIPGKIAYEDPAYPAERLCLLGLKTTCKDRWRQILNEGSRVPEKYLLTLQKGISVNQLNEMAEARVTLVVPKPLQKAYPLGSRMKILSVEQFLDVARKLLA